MSMNAFELLGFEPALEIDATELSARFERLRAQFHPDHYATASGLERRLAVQRAAAINDAHAILSDPIARAQHLLELRGIARDEAATVQDPAFLMQQMELREAAEEAQTPEAHDQLRVRVQALWDSAWAELNRGLAAMDNEAALRALQRLQFLRRFLEQLPRQEPA